MRTEVRDFNGADAYFDDRGSAEWDDLEVVLNELMPHFHPSDQAGMQGTSIFDPKGTNAALNAGVRRLGRPTRSGSNES